MDVQVERTDVAGWSAARAGLSVLCSLGFHIVVVVLGGLLRIRVSLLVLMPGFFYGAWIARVLGPWGTSGGGWFSALGPIVLCGAVADLILYAVVFYVILTLRARRQTRIDVAFRALSQ